MSEASAFRRSTPPQAPADRVSTIDEELVRIRTEDEPTTPVRRPAGFSDENRQAREQLKAIHEELDKLRQRREELEQRRKQLLATSIPPRPASASHASVRDQSSHADSIVGTGRRLPGPSPTAMLSAISLSQSNYMHPTTSSRARTESIPRDRRGSAAADSRTSSEGWRDGPHSQERRHGTARSTVFADSIPSEKERRQNLRETPHLLVKNGMREAAKHDSAIVMGSFLLEDQSKIYTFGRERRFMPVVGQRGSYYLATDVALAHDEARLASSHSGLLSRCPDWHSTPGPGAYTPRYSKLAKPSPLTYLH